MAKQIQEILIDDLDGGEANETVASRLTAPPMRLT